MSKSDLNDKKNWKSDDDPDFTITFSAINQIWPQQHVDFIQSSYYIKKRVTIKANPSTDHFSRNNIALMESAASIDYVKDILQRLHSSPPNFSHSSETYQISGRLLASGMEGLYQSRWMAFINWTSETTPSPQKQID